MTKAIFFFNFPLRFLQISRAPSTFTEMKFLTFKKLNTSLSDYNALNHPKAFVGVVLGFSLFFLPNCLLSRPVASVRRGPLR